MLGTYGSHVRQAENFGFISRGKNTSMVAVVIWSVNVNAYKRLAFSHAFNA